MFFSKDKKKDNIDLYKILFDTYSPKIYKTAYCILKNEADAKDVLQEAFITAFNKIDSLKDKEKFDAWICTIALNLAKQKYNKNKKEVFVDDNILSTNFKQDFDLPIDIALKNEIVEILREHIDNLINFEEIEVPNLSSSWEVIEKELRNNCNKKSKKFNIKVACIIGMIALLGYLSIGINNRGDANFRRILNLVINEEDDYLNK